MKLSYCIATMMPGFSAKCLQQAIPLAGCEVETVVMAHGDANADDIQATRVLRSEEILGYPEAMHRAYKASTGDVILFTHDDVMIYEEGWGKQLLREFYQKGLMGLAGFAGAKGLGAHDMYSGPFEVPKMGRLSVYTSMQNWRDHGHHAKVPVQVGMLDGLSLCFRRTFLDAIGGWRWFPYPHHGYDLAISCMAARHKQEVWVLPIECTHLGGQTSCMTQFQEWAKAHHGGDLELHRASHEWTFNNFRDVLPIRVP